MKERFAKLLLGEDMSGGGKGVCTALAISNAITNLSGEIHLCHSICRCSCAISFDCYKTTTVFSYCVRRALEIGAPCAAEEGNVAPGDGLVALCE